MQVLQKAVLATRRDTSTIGMYEFDFFPERMVGSVGSWSPRDV
jgi:hypothetical protein